MNLLPNTEWKVNSGMGLVPKMNLEGSGTLSPNSVTGYTTNANQITVSVANIYQLQPGHLGVFDGAAHANLKLCAFRVDSVSGNTFTGTLPLGLTAPTSAACQFHPSVAGDYGSTGCGPDGWDKDQSLHCWIEDNAVNLDVGVVRALGCKKTSAGPQTIHHDVPAWEIAKYRGRTISFGIRGYQKHGAYGFRVRINDSGTYTNGNTATGSGYQDSAVTAAISSACTALSFVVEMLGDTGAVYYFAKPMGNPGSTLLPWWPKSEILKPRVFVPVVTFTNASVTLPGPDSYGNYGFRFQPDAETNGKVLGVRQMFQTWEGRCSMQNDAIALTSSRSPPQSAHSFCRYATTADQMQCSSHLATMGDDGDAFFYTINENTNWYNMSLELDGFVL